MKKRAFKNGSNIFEQAVSSADRFSRDEDGGVFTIFVALGFLLIFATAGIGVDIMNFERDRASLQGALDRAVLAAANVKQELPPKDVVLSYIEKSNVRGELTGEPIVEDEPDIGQRKVTAHAAVDVKTHFMYFFGYPTLKASVTSVAEEAIGSVEISLVLDISGSMGQDSATKVTMEDGSERTLTKLEALQDAATQFVTTMYEKENPDKISISIIPYNNQVNAGPNILDNMPGVTTEHNYSHCVDFSDTATDNDFEEYWIDPAESLNRAAHFDLWSRGDDYRSEARTNQVCTTRAGSSITPVTNVISDLHDQIAAMTHGGNTSIDIGVKWGAALLDPQFQPVINSLTRQDANPGVSTKKVVPTTFDNRPLEYESNVKKVLVVMTDGQNTENWVLDDEYRSGLSDVWYNPNYEYTGRVYWRDSRGRSRSSNRTWRGEYSVRISEDPPVYHWTRHNQQNSSYADTNDNSVPFGGEADDQSVRLTYPELWNRVNLDWNAAYNYSWQDNHDNTWHWNAFTEISRTTKDTRLQEICGAVKGKNVDIYGIAFEAPTNGVTAINNCSSGEGFFFEVNDGGSLGTDNLSLAQVFQTIAASIKQLRLTQ
ncbi:TadE/TadG family type IV pilus assembly protein [Ruegeria sp. ANG10]|uniref:TadE/TadG family type IV pilus assembly protein n=1 Tax=Ruegeria sp. ANG10 TaxID=3042467 RepID=UPI003451B5FF